MRKCNECGSYAINPGHDGRDMVSDLDLCNVCYWRKMAEKYRGQRDELITLWKSRDGSINNMLALIKRIKEADGD